ncbi:MAG: hypothetical protein IT285_13125 [Bdellovibrionales bacterium]|nr:hypothetical protein [Bdellovibrionales bacterium]
MRIAVASPLLLFALLSPRPVWAWGSHFLVTARALEHPDFTCGGPVQIEELDSFLRAQAEPLRTLFDDYYSALLARHAKRVRAQTFDSASPRRETFLRAARLNPETFFPLGRRMLPQEGPAPSGNPAGRESLVRENPGAMMDSARVILTHSDEPDWKMDFGLWGIEAYGYGERPYGNSDGESDKAPFHMQFWHENLLVKTFAPEITEGLVPERVELFTRLAALAFSSGHSYWGLRFSAWALHYIQDLGQPYHSKAVPSGDWLYYLKFVISSDKARIKKETTQLVANRHFAYEDFVAHGLARSYLAPAEPLTAELARFLNQGGLLLQPAPGNPLTLLRSVAAFAAQHAPALDPAVVQAYGARMTEDPLYNLETDDAYQAAELISQLPAAAAQRILKETGVDFMKVGQATRTYLSMIPGSPCSQK